MSEETKHENIDKKFNLKINEPELQEYIEQLRFQLYVAESNNEYFMEELKRLDEENKNLKVLLGMSKVQLIAPKVKVLGLSKETKVKEG